MEQPFYRDTWAEINLDHIFYNVSMLKKRLPDSVTLMAVVKANAYGHGDVQVAKTALGAGATYLAVAFLDEAIALRKQGIDEPILVLGASRPEDVEIAVKFNITLTVFSEDWLIKSIPLLNEDHPLSIHVKIDTGMGRIGVREKDELRRVEEIVTTNPKFNFEGIFTHFATADELDTSYYHQQLTRFKEMLSFLKQMPNMIHCSNSAAALRFTESLFNAVRMGISMYGLTPSLEMVSELPFPLKEAFALRSKLVFVKEINKGEKVSYGATYEASGKEWIGTLPIGYADGWIRKLQGQEVLVNGKRAQIIGRICMDQTMVRLPHYIEPGEVVTLIGSQGEDVISVNEIAAKLDTINYEVTCMMSNRIPRVFIQNGSRIETTNGLIHSS
jgi:alanine racemase